MELMNHIFEWQTWLLDRPVYFGLFFIVMWCMASFVISRYTGWNKLADRYETRSKPNTKLIKMVQVNWGSMMTGGNIYVIGSTHEGLYLNVMFPFKVGHSALLIPWRDINTKVIEGWYQSRVQLNFGADLSKPFQISEKTARKVREGSNDQFSY